MKVQNLFAAASREPQIRVVRVDHALSSDESDQRWPHGSVHIDSGPRGGLGTQCAPRSRRQLLTRGRNARSVVDLLYRVCLRARQTCGSIRLLADQLDRLEITTTRILQNAILDPIDGVAPFEHFLRE